MKWVLPLMPLLFLVACGGSSQEVTPTLSPLETAAPATPSAEQARYNEFLETSREFARKTPLASCDPAFWGMLIKLLTIGEPTHRGLAELSIIDACLEVGELSNLFNEFSNYYAEAPPP